MNDRLFPPNLLTRAVSLEAIGAAEIAWHREDALEVLQDLRTASVAVLGGDVLISRKGEIEYAYSNWHSDSRSTEDWPSYVLRSQAEARNYITACPPASDGELLFVLVLVDETDFETLSQ